MTTQTTEKGMALAERETTRLQHSQELVGGVISTPDEYANRIRQLQGQAHILSPMSAVAFIAPQHVVNPMIVVIDPSVDAQSGRGADVYFQRSIHKNRKIGTGRDARYEPEEVSLNKIGLQKILSAAGANVYPPTREFRDRYWWIVTHEADILTFDGRYVRLPAGTASVDLRDGSADIDEWTPEAWAEAVRVAEEQKKRVIPDEQWKVKPSIPGCAWTRERVMQQRKFGLELAETKSLNRLARNLGIKQSYTMEELRKPFVIFRASYVPDLSNPRVAEMYAAQNLGARITLYPGASAPQQVPLVGGPVSHAAGDPGGTFDGETIPHEPESPEAMKTAPLPENLDEIAFDEQKAETPRPDVYRIAKVAKVRGEERYFIETAEQVTLYTPDRALAQALAKAAKDGEPREIPSERVAVDGKPYRQVIEVLAIGGLKL